MIKLQNPFYALLEKNIEKSKIRKPPISFYVKPTLCVLAVMTVMLIAFAFMNTNFADNNSIVGGIVFLSVCFFFISIVANFVRGIPGFISRRRTKKFFSSLKPEHYKQLQIELINWAEQIKRRETHLEYRDEYKKELIPGLEQMAKGRRFPNFEVERFLWHAVIGRDYQRVASIEDNCYDLDPEFFLIRFKHEIFTNATNDAKPPTYRDLYKDRELKYVVETWGRLENIPLGELLDMPCTKDFVEFVQKMGLAKAQRDSKNISDLDSLMDYQGFPRGLSGTASYDSMGD